MQRHHTKSSSSGAALAVKEGSTRGGQGTPGENKRVGRKGSEMEIAVTRGQGEGEECQ